MCILSLFGKQSQKAKEMEQRVEFVSQWLDQNCIPIGDGDYLNFEIAYREKEQSFIDSFELICKEIIEDDNIVQPVKLVAQDFLQKEEVFISPQSPFNDDNYFIGIEKTTELMKGIHQKYYQDKLSSDFTNTICTKMYFCFFK